MAAREIFAGQARQGVAEREAESPETGVSPEAASLEAASVETASLETESLVRALREELQIAERRVERERVSSGSRVIDELVGEGGFGRGDLVEWLADGSGRSGGWGSGASSLALVGAAAASREGGKVVVVDRRGSFYPPAAVTWGVALEALVVVRAANEADELWAVDQVLRSDQVASVVAWPERLEGRVFRRLQLAAEEGGVVGMLIRSARYAREPSWAQTRLLVRGEAGVGESEGRRVRLEALRSRGSQGGGNVVLDIDEVTGEIREANPVSLVSSLGAATVAVREARA